MSAGVPAPPERKVIMAECHVCGVSGGLTVSVVVADGSCLDLWKCVISQWPASTSGITMNKGWLYSKAEIEDCYQCRIRSLR